MTNTIENLSAIGTDVVVTKHGPNVVFRNYLVDRPAYTKAMKAAEAVLEVQMTFPHSARKLWPIFSNFNAWMKRFGYMWDELPANREDSYAHLGDAGTGKYDTGEKTRYVVRKVIAEQLIYFDSFPLQFSDKDSVWTGHNLVSLYEASPGVTTISFFMEHTWYSETMSIEELRKDARDVMFELALNFWRDYFVHDLTALVEELDAASA